MAGSQNVTHVTIRGEHGLPVQIPAWEMEKILTGARGGTQDAIQDTTTDEEVLRGIRARTRDGVRRWALEHDVPFVPDE